MKLILALVFFTFIQCDYNVEVNKSADEMKKNMKKPMPEPEVEKLLSIKELDALREWILIEENRNIIIRVPITATFEDSKTFGPDQLIIGDIREYEKTIELYLNDTRMGIGIASHLLTGCETNLCSFWVDLIWQEMDGNHSKVDDDGKYTVMALAYVEDTEELDREFIYVRK